MDIAHKGTVGQSFSWCDGEPVCNGEKRLMPVH